MMRTSQNGKSSDATSRPKHNFSLTTALPTTCYVVTPRIRGKTRYKYWYLHLIIVIMNKTFNRALQSASTARLAKQNVRSLLLTTCAQKVYFTNSITSRLCWRRNGKPVSEVMWPVSIAWTKRGRNVPDTRGCHKHVQRVKLIDYVRCLS